jgi:hypothetical protein
MAEAQSWSPESRSALIVLTTALLSGLLLLAVTLLATLSGLLALLLARLLLAAALLSALLSLTALTALVLIHAVLPGCPSIVATVQNPTRSVYFRLC